MTLRRYWLTFLAVAMSMLVTQGAFADQPVPGPEAAAAEAETAAADEAYGALLRDIEADPSAAVNKIVSRLSPDDAAAQQLRATLENLSTKKLAEIYANANTVDDVESILSADLSEDSILALKDLDKDYVYTPVPPCRILDTRIVGGAFSPGVSREYYVYGGFDISSQGGNPAGCFSPRGEPRAVHINITVVPLAGNGYFKAYPANIVGPNASIINYRSGVQNIANAATIQTYYSIGPREIEFQNFNGTAHLIVDILGYYHEVDNVEKIVASDTSGTQTSGLSVGTSYTTLASRSVSVPSAGRVIIMGEASWSNSGSNYLGCEFRENGTQVDFWWWEAGDSLYIDLHQNRFYQKTVTSGTKTYDLRCYRSGGTSAYAYYRNLVVIFIQEDL
jgi:hypothetical protein